MILNSPMGARDLGFLKFESWKKIFGGSPSEYLNLNPFFTETSLFEDE